MIFAEDCSRDQLRTYQSCDWLRTVLCRAAQPARVAEIARAEARDGTAYQRATRNAST